MQKITMYLVSVGKFLPLIVIFRNLKGMGGVEDKDQQKQIYLQMQ